MTSYSFYYEAKKNHNAPVIELTDEENETRNNDYQEILGMKEHHKDQHSAWEKAGNFYNITQSGQGADDISRFAIGLSRTIVDTGISMINEGEPEGDFKPIGPADESLSIMWNALTKHVLNKSNWKAHQKLFTTDLHIFGSSALEAFVNPVIRRKNEPAGLFLIRLAKTARTGLRHRSIWKCFRNPNVLDPDEVPSGAWEEVITHSTWVTKYAQRKDFKNVAKVPLGSKYKLTHLANENENTYRIYCLPFGKMAEASYEEHPNDTELGMVVCDKPLTKLNPLGMVPLAFGTFNDQLTGDYKQHSLYGMGIPQMIQGMELINEGLFNMTIDNMRLKNTVPVGYQPYSGQTDFIDIDNIGVLESGRVYPGQFHPQSLGIADLSSNTVLWEWVNNQCIWLTGYNFQQLGGDTSKTAFEFAQRLKANSNRALARLKGLENGPLKRGWTLLLANTLQQVTKDEWEEITGQEANDITKLIQSGELATNDFSFENGKAKSKKFVEYFDVEDFDIKEDFSKRKNRKLDSKSLDNTLLMKEKKGAKSKVPAVPEYLFKGGNIAHMLAFTVEIKSKAMLGDIRVRDSEAINRTLQTGAGLMQAVPNITPELIFDLWKQDAKASGLDIESTIGKAEESGALEKISSILEQMEGLQQQQPQPQGNPNVPNVPPTSQENQIQPPQGNIPATLAERV